MLIVANTKKSDNCLNGKGRFNLKGKLLRLEVVGTGRQKRMNGIFEDETGQIALVWFKGVQFLSKSLKPGLVYQLYGKPKMFNGRWSIPHPEMTEWINVDAQVGWQGVYSSTEKLSGSGLHSKGLARLITTLCESIGTKIPEILPNSLLLKYQLMNRGVAFQKMHLPNSIDDARKATTRFKFEELFYLQMELLHRKQISFQKSKGFVFEKLENFLPKFYNDHLPFELTGAQKRVVKEIRADVKTGKHMNRLLQGDVGSGKTLVAVLSMLMALDNGFQAAIMAPTEILANQHYVGIQELLAPMDVKIGLLTGSTKKSERDKLHESLRNGKLQILVGTHALLEKEVRFQNLGLVVIDEQHRFGDGPESKNVEKEYHSTSHLDHDGSSNSSYPCHDILRRS